VDNKLIVALSAIALRQAQATVATEQAVHHLLGYVAMYPNDGIVYRASKMILCAHADAGYLNETRSRSQAGAHIFLSEDDPYPRYNGAILSIAQIIKFVMASASKAELAAIFITAREMIPHRQTLIDMLCTNPRERLRLTLLCTLLLVLIRRKNAIIPMDVLNGSIGCIIQPLLKTLFAHKSLTCSQGHLVLNPN
jgi:hypothetical protein